jgi:spore coat polysaccharide biosynthesis predicted glycosyltransferase SpsG
MSVENKVFGQLNRVEFKSQKFDFGLIEDIRANLDKAFQFVEIQSEIISIENKIKKSLPIYQSVINDADNGIKKLQEIGIDGGLISSLSKQKSEAVNGMKSAQTLISYISKAI